MLHVAHMLHGLAIPKKMIMPDMTHTATKIPQSLSMNATSDVLNGLAIPVHMAKFNMVDSKAK